MQNRTVHCDILFVSIELALIYFRHYTRMISFVLAMVYLQI